MLDTQNFILENYLQHRNMLAVKINPISCIGSKLARTIAILKTNTPDFVFITDAQCHGGNSINSLVELLKDELNCRIIFTPIQASQFSLKADLTLYVSLLSGRNANYLVTYHTKSAKQIKDLSLPILPTAFLHIESDRITHLQYQSQSLPIPRDAFATAVSTAITAELLGFRLLYLDTDNENSIVPLEMIQDIRENVNIPIIVGGGIKDTQSIKNACNSGANIVVIDYDNDSIINDISNFLF